MRLARLKSHQLGTNDESDELNNEYETRVETTGTAVDASGSIMILPLDPTRMEALSERCSAVVLKLNNQEMANASGDIDEHRNHSSGSLSNNNNINSSNPRCLSHSCSTSEDENNLSFANSRTIIKP